MTCLFVDTSPDVQQNTGEDPQLAPWFLEFEHFVLNKVLPLLHKFFCPPLCLDTSGPEVLEGRPRYILALLLQDSQVIVQANGGASKLASGFEHRDLMLFLLKLHCHNTLCSIASPLLQALSTDKATVVSSFSASIAPTFSFKESRLSTSSCSKFSEHSIHLLPGYLISQVLILHLRVCQARHPGQDVFPLT